MGHRGPPIQAPVAQPLTPGPLIEHTHKAILSTLRSTPARGASSVHEGQVVGSANDAAFASPPATRTKEPCERARGTDDPRRVFAVSTKLLPTQAMGRPDAAPLLTGGLSRTWASPAPFQTLRQRRFPPPRFPSHNPHKESRWTGRTGRSIHRASSASRQGRFVRSLSNIQPRGPAGSGDTNTQAIEPARFDSYGLNRLHEASSASTGVP